jgi:hypothetical protein
MTLRVLRMLTSGLVLGLMHCDRASPPVRSTGSASFVAPAGSDASVPVTSDPIGGQEGCTGVAAAPQDRANRVEWLKAAVAQWTSRFEKEWLDASGALGCPAPSRTSKGAVHDLGDYAFAKLVTEGDSAPARARAEAALRCLFTFQKVGPKGDLLAGAFPFHYGDDINPKENPTEFALAPLAGLVTHRGLSAELKQELAPRVLTALDAVERHPVCPKYTNICLLQIAEMLSLGGLLEEATDPRIREEGKARVASGKARLDDWLAFTRRAGIAEYDSPTYAEVDVTALLLALRGSQDEGARAGVRGALDFLWSDLAANYSPGRGGLAGPYSRTYDFVTGQGAASVSYFVEGLRAEPPERGALSGGMLSPIVHLLEEQQSQYRPSLNALCLSAEPEREIASTFGSGGAGKRERYAYVAPELALGSVSADYGTSLDSNQDEPIWGIVGSSPKSAAITVLSDYLDSPGVQVKRGNFTKPTHLLMSPAAAQSKGTLLALLRVQAADPKYKDSKDVSVPLVNLATNILIPADADETLVDGRPVERDRDVALDVHSTLLVRTGTGALAISIVDSGGLECPDTDGGSSERRPPVVRLKPFESGDATHGPTLRVVIYHETELPKVPRALTGCFARAALLFAGERCDTPGCAEDLVARVAAANRAAKRVYDARTGDWDVSVRVASGPELRVHRTVRGEGGILAREIDGHERVFPPLAVNGRAILLRP